MIGASTELVVAGVPAAVLVVALVQLGRALGLPKQYAPAAAVVAGVVVALLGEVAVGSDLGAALVAGLVLGLSATGAHSAITKTVGGAK